MRIRQRILSALVILVIIPAMLGGALLFLHRGGFFNLSQVEILIEGPQENAHYLKPQVEIVKNFMAHFKGTSLWALDLPDLQKELRRQAWLENLVIVRNWPDSLTLKIKAFDVKMLLLTKQGQFLPMIKDGLLLEPVDMKSAPDATILRGEVFHRSPELRRKALRVLDEIPTEGSFNRHQVSELFYREKEGFWVSLIRRGTDVRLGQDQIPLKSARVGQVLDYLQSHQIEARVIDADLSQKVLVRSRKGP